jgi:hypothetical protein
MTALFYCFHEGKDCMYVATLKRQRVTGPLTIALSDRALKHKEFESSDYQLGVGFATLTPAYML